MRNGSSATSRWKRKTGRYWRIREPRFWTVPAVRRVDGEMPVKRLVMFACVALGCGLAHDAPPAWSRPFAAHRVVGNVYYVGTYDLACFLITSPRGHVLINTGLKDSAPLI